MEDLLTAHADRVLASNTAHSDRANAIVAKADAALRASISALGLRLLEVAKLADDAQATAAREMREAVDGAQEELIAVLNDNLIEIAGSGAAMHLEMDERTAFLACGKLPVRDPLLKSDPAMLALPATQEGAPTIEGELSFDAEHGDRATIENLRALEAAE